MSERAPLVRRINMLPVEPHGSTTGFFRALEDADDMVHERGELLCRCDELSAAIDAIKLLHERGVWEATGKFYCKHCWNREVEWPCPTMKLAGGAGS